MGGRVQAASRGCKQSKRWPAAVMDFFVQGHKAVSLQLVLLWFYNDSAALNVCALRPAWWAGKKVDTLTMKITPKVKLRLLEPWKEIWKWFICFYRVESIYRCPHIHIDSGRNPPPLLPVLNEGWCCFLRCRDQTSWFGYYIVCFVMHVRSTHLHFCYGMKRLLIRWFVWKLLGFQVSGTVF